nr:LacI family DNA-binding transcriptional regulator [uncultured Cohaesibacter sp.]
MAKRRSSSSRKPTLVDVAKAANVSAITVSRTIRSPELVSPQMRVKVEEAIEKLGYSPDPAASALASKVTYNIGLLLPSLTNTVFEDVLEGIYLGSEDTRFFIQIGDTRYSALKEEALIGTFLRQKPAGLIVTGFEQTEKARGMLAAAHCPIVQIMDFGEPPIDMAVGFDHEAAGHAAARHLIECGYRAPGAVGARLDSRSRRRLDGFRKACQEVGLWDERRMVITPQSSSVGLGRHLLEELLSRDQSVDAVFCNNDDLGIGTLMEAQRRLISVPEQLGICSFHDMEMTQHMYPALTAIATPRFQIGKMAIDMLLAEIEEPRSVKRRNIDTGFELVVRDSTRRSG